MDALDNKNFILYCARYYNNPHCSGMEEFYEDLRRIKYIKKLFTRYKRTGELKERLILNHFIILNNVFGPEALLKIILFKMKDYLPYAKPFLILLNVLPENMLDNVPMDAIIVERLRNV